MSSIQDLNFIPNKIPASLKDLTGLIFGRLSVQGYCGGSRWLCVCECGSLKAIEGRYLSAGRSKSCGCGKRKHKTKKRWGHKLYNIWNGIRQRCNNPNRHSYPYYGGRGIQLCQRWSEDFFAFVEDMGHRPDGHSIDRIDNDAHYSCGSCSQCIKNGWKANCRWASNEMQNNNSRKNRRITIGGQEKTLAQWCGGYGTEMYRRAANRIHNGLWCEECAFTIPRLGSKCTHIKS